MPSNRGAFAILCSDVETDLPENLVGSQRDAFRKEADEIAIELAAIGIESQVFPAYSLDDAVGVLAERAFSSIVTIGNGNLSSCYAKNGYQFDWSLVSGYATHLKTGRFIQRHCGQAIRTMSVPLGTFAMARHSDVFAAHDVTLPTVMDDEHESAIIRLHSYPRLGYEALKSLFPPIDRNKDETVVVLENLDPDYLLSNFQ